MQDIIAGPHPHSLSGLGPKLDYPLTYPGIDGWVLAYDPEFMGEPDADYRRNSDAAVQSFRRARGRGAEVHLPWNIDEVGRHAASMEGCWRRRSAPSWARGPGW